MLAATNCRHGPRQQTPAGQKAHSFVQNLRGCFAISWYDRGCENRSERPVFGQGRHSRPRHETEKSPARFVSWRHGVTQTMGNGVPTTHFSYGTLQQAHTPTAIQVSTIGTCVADHVCIGEMQRNGPRLCRRNRPYFERKPRNGQGNCPTRRSRSPHASPPGASDGIARTRPSSVITESRCCRRARHRGCLARRRRRGRRPRRRR
jgi:hypothetical protein